MVEGIVQIGVEGTPGGYMACQMISQQQTGKPYVGVVEGLVNNTQEVFEGDNTLEKWMYVNYTPVIAPHIIGLGTGLGKGDPIMAAENAVYLAGDAAMVLGVARGIGGLCEVKVNKIGKGTPENPSSFEAIVTGKKCPIFLREELWAKYGDRKVFSREHVREGIMELGTKEAIKDQVNNMISENLDNLKEGDNFIYRKMNGQDMCATVHVKNGKITSMNAYKGINARANPNKVNIIDQR